MATVAATFSNLTFSSGRSDEGSGGSGGGGGNGGFGGGGGGGDRRGEDDAWSGNCADAMLALAEAGRSLDSLPKDLAAAIEAGMVPGSIIAAEQEKRKEKFTKELDFVCADVVMALIADFMLVWLPAPTVSLRPPLAVSVGPLAKFLNSYPDNAFQVID
ncbi:protein RETICULATA-RELATED 4, chloroplastic-like [Carica papaya]|uniref:protein RETICULATA-RELATED 4, chloroplastic-like n=1 Tax=Carica papaya TaxID=3649 RepID=UPI000B8C96C3|nr:protein RETICULATA-RELATED 4, chloroplastic-like [Carica papaya]